MESDLPIPALLLAALPIITVAIALIAGIVFLPRQSAETRSQAASIAASPTPISAVRSEAPASLPTVTTPSPGPVIPQVACSQLYSPVCGDDGRTYINACEATLANIAIVSSAECNR